MKTKLFWIGCLFMPVLLFSQLKVSIADGNWNSASTWSPSGTPSSSDKIKIYHVVTLNQNFTASDTIFVFNELDLNSNRTLSLNPGTMVLVNNATYTGQIGTVGSGAAIVGNFTFQKWISRCDGSSTYGFPFDTDPQSVNWYYCNQCMPSWSNIYYYNESTSGTYNNGYYDTITGNVKRGKGFFYWYSNYSGGLNFPRQVSTKGSIDFTTSFNFKVSYTSSSSGSSNDGYNLVANPFPGTIDWLSGSWSKRRIDNAIYTWSSCGNTFAAYVNGVGVNGGSRYISSMQGFWVKTNNNNPQLKIYSGAMTNSSSNLLRPSSTDSVKKILRLSLGDDEIAIRLDSLSTDSFDVEKDAISMLSDNSRLYSRTNYKQDQNYAINSIPDGNGSVYIKTRGEGSLNISGVETFMNAYTIQLKNLRTGELTNISDNLLYPFRDSSTVSFQENFEIRFVQKQTTGVREQMPHTEQIRVRRSGDRVYISAPQTETTSNVNVYDLQGRLLYNEQFKTETNMPYLNQPVIIKITNEKGNYVKKMF